MDGKFLQEVFEQLASSPRLKDFVDGLEWNVFGELRVRCGITDTTDLGSTDDPKEIEVIECPGGFRKAPHQVRTKSAFREVHVSQCPGSFLNR